MKEVKAILTRKKETKNTVRYDHPEGKGICPAVYLKKKHIHPPYPEHIELTVGLPEDT